MHRRSHELTILKPDVSDDESYRVLVVRGDGVNIKTALATADFRDPRHISEDILLSDIFPRQWVPSWDVEGDVIR